MPATQRADHDVQADPGTAVAGKPPKSMGNEDGRFTGWWFEAL